MDLKHMEWLQGTLVKASVPGQTQLQHKFQRKPS